MHRSAGESGMNAVQLRKHNHFYSIKNSSDEFCCFYYLKTYTPPLSHSESQLRLLRASIVCSNFLSSYAACCWISANGLGLIN